MAHLQAPFTIFLLCVDGSVAGSLPLYTVLVAQSQAPSTTVCRINGSLTGPFYDFELCVDGSDAGLLPLYAMLMVQSQAPSTILCPQGTKALCAACQLHRLLQPTLLLTQPSVIPINVKSHSTFVSWIEFLALYICQHVKEF